MTQNRHTVAGAFLLAAIAANYPGFPDSWTHAQTQPTPSAEVFPGAGKNLITVIDGDTVEMGGHRYRLAGIDAPEIHFAKCAAERERGIRAAARLMALLAERPNELVTVSKSGGFGRRLGRLTIGAEGASEDWAVIAAREGHGVSCAGSCARKDHDWCKVP